MLRSMKDLENYAIGATDGPIGQVKDFYFDDQAWVIRYLVVEAGSWLSGRKVLISPMSVQHADWAARLLPVAITQEQVRNSPDIDTQQPVSRQHERDHLGYYGHPYYWDGLGLWGEGRYPHAWMADHPATGVGRVEPDRRPAANTSAGTSAGVSAEASAEASAESNRHRNDDPHLRSCQAIVGHHIHATDGEIGHVDGMLVDDETWAICYLVVNTSNWWMGHQVLLAPPWITGVHWSDRSVTVGLSRQAIRDAPAYDPSAPLNREQETGLHDHHDRPVYWGSGGA